MRKATAVTGGTLTSVLALGTLALPANAVTDDTLISVDELAVVVVGNGET